VNADKKISAAVFLTLFLAVSPPAPCGDFSLSLEARAGLLAGTTREYVYEGEKQISRLDWKVKAVPCIDTALGFSWKGFFVKGSVNAAIPSPSGFMRDYDWLLPGSDEMTNFSEHNAVIDRHNDYGVSLGYNFAPGNWRLSPSAGFVYSNRKWTASDGYYRYAPSGSALQGGEPETPVTGPVVTYEQKISYLYAGLTAGYRFPAGWSADALVRVSPYIWAESMDHHIFRSAEFLDIMAGGFGGLVGLSAGYKPQPDGNWEVFAGFSFEGVILTKGTTSSRTAGVDKPSVFIPAEKNGSGYDDALWRFFSGVRFSAGF
jgi:outer membrane protease